MTILYKHDKQTFLSFEAGICVIFYSAPRVDEFEYHVVNV